MKRNVILILTFIQMNVLFGQTSLNFNFGSNYSLFHIASDYADINEFSSELSYNFGSSIKFEYNNKHIFLLKVNYIDYSTKVEMIAGSASHVRNYNYDLNLGYLSCSFLPQCSFGKTKSIFLQAGPYFAVLVNSKMDGELTGYGPSTYDPNMKLTGSANEYFKEIDYGLFVFIGKEFNINEQLSISPQIGYNYGLNNIGDGYHDTYSISVNTRSIILEMNLEYRFN